MMDFSSNVIGKLVSSGVLNTNNIGDAALITMLYSSDIIDSKFAALCLDIRTHSQCLINDMSTENMKLILRDCEISMPQIHTRRNSRVRGDYAKMSSYTDNCMRKIKYFSEQIMQARNSQLVGDIINYCELMHIDPKTFSSTCIMKFAESCGTTIDQYYSVAIAYRLRTGKFFVMKPEYRQHMQMMYINACRKLLRDSSACRSNIPDAISIIYIVMQYGPVRKYEELKSFMVMLSISTSAEKIAAITNIIFNT